jgi:hypothetical protein
MKRKKKQGRVGRPKSQAYKPRYDLGTPELAYKKAQATNGEDPALSTTALDRMFAREQITREQRQAGFRYLMLRRQVFGKLGAQIGAYSDMVGTFKTVTDRSEDEQLELEDEFIAADDALRDAGRVSYRVTRAVILEDIESPSEALCGGLNALSDFWGLR